MAATTELVLVVLALPACLIWLIFPFIAMKRMRELQKAMEAGNKFLAIISEEMQSLSQPKPHIAATPAVKVVPKARVMSSSGIITPPPSVVPLKISKGGQEFGLKDTVSIKVMLKNGELTLQDHYFNKETNEWTTLDNHPEIREQSGGD